MGDSPVRPGYVIALAAIVFVAVGVYVFVRLHDHEPLMAFAPKPKPPPEAWERSMGDAVPAPLPTALPLVGPVGVDADGYPTQYVDQPSLQSLLRHHRYDELTKYMTEIQDAFEKDPRKETWITDAAHAFASSKPELDVLFDEWVAKNPGSFAPWLARGSHRVESGFARRGGGAAKETSAEALRAMDEAFDAAWDDLEKALSIRSKIVIAYQDEIRITSVHSERRTARSLLDDANRFCPSCFLVKMKYIHFLTPRWGGSYAKMHAFAAEWNTSMNPRFGLLDGYPDFDQCDLAQMQEKLSVADAAVARALAKGDYWKFYDCRGRTRWGRDDFARARDDFARADELSRGQPDALANLAQMEVELGHDAAAAHALLTAVRIDLGNSRVHDAWPYVVGKLQKDALDSAKADPAGALALLDLAWQLQPRESATLELRAELLVGKTPQIGSAATVEELEPGLATHPDDLAFHQAFDFALARAGQFQRVVDMWTSYIAAHPDEALAYMERSGAYYHLTNTPAMLADQKKACELGWLEGCGRNPR